MSDLRKFTVYSKGKYAKNWIWCLTTDSISEAEKTAMCYSANAYKTKVVSVDTLETVCVYKDCIKIK